METNKLTPEESLRLITQVITQARNKYEENGFIFMLWGILIAISSISQFVLIINNFQNISGLPYFLMPIGGIYTSIYYSKKGNNENNNIIYKVVRTLWIVISINLLVLGFLYSNTLKENLIPIILILLSIGTIILGTSINSKLFIISGLIICLSAYLGFYLDWLYKPLLMGIVSIIAIFIPGLILMIQNKKKKYV